MVQDVIVMDIKDGHDWHVDVVCLTFVGDLYIQTVYENVCRRLNFFIEK
jgi:hypothetical protein